MRVILPDEKALCPVVVPPLGSDKFHINSCLIHVASPWGTRDSPYPSPIASHTYHHQLRIGLVLGQSRKKKKYVKSTRKRLRASITDQGIKKLL